MSYTPEVGEILQAAMPKIKNYLDQCVQEQYEMCMKKGFDLRKYYIWILYYKNNHTGKLVLRPAIIRVTRPSPYQDEDMLLWSVTNYDKVKFEYAIPKKETLNYILANPEKFDKEHVRMLRAYCSDKLERIEDYSINGKIA